MQKPAQGRAVFDHLSVPARLVFVLYARHVRLRQHLAYEQFELVRGNFVKALPAMTRYQRIPPMRRSDYFCKDNLADFAGQYG